MNPDPFLEACPQLRSWPFSRGTMRSCRGRGNSAGSWLRHRQGKGHGCKEAHGASMHAAPRSSLLLSKALQALPLGHHRVSEDGKWVSEGCFSD